MIDPRTKGIAAPVSSGNLWKIIATLALFLIWLGTMAIAQDNGVSLGELARKERERKAAAKAARSTAPVVDLLNVKKDCGGDWTCFLTALDENTAARMIFPDRTEASEPHSAIVSSEVVLETDKVLADSAVLTGSTRNTTVRITDPERARLLLQGYGRQAIDALEQQMETGSRRQDGLVVT